jgi:RimJ/RimL family protein N-acetyltransferase
MPKTRYAPMREALHAAFDMFELQRIQAQVSAKNVGLNRNLRRLGFVWEGTIRRGWIGTNGYFHDMCVLGMLREDLTSGTR